MRKSKSSYRKSVLFKGGIVFSILLTSVSLIFFFMGKADVNPAKGKREGSIQTEIQQQQLKLQQQLKQLQPDEMKEVQPPKQKRPDGKPLGKVVYLTFDDGPSSLTGEFLDILEEHNVKATFFMQGNNMQNTRYRENVRRATNEGHYVGAHSMTHNSRKLYSEGQFVHEMEETLSVIHTITNTKPKLVRAPYGSQPGLKDEHIRNQIVDAGIKVWDWTIDSYDWRLGGNPNLILENIKNQTKADVEVVLMHEKIQTLQALPEIISFYKGKGYEFGVYNDSDHFQLNFQKDERL